MKDLPVTRVGRYCVSIGNSSILKVAPENNTYIYELVLDANWHWNENNRHPIALSFAFLTEAKVIANITPDSSIVTDNIPII